MREIEKYGVPDAIFFSFEINKYYMIWGFDDIYSISKEQINNKNILKDLQNKITSWKDDSSEIAAVGFLSYDAKNIFFPNINFQPLKSDSPILWFGKPAVIKIVNKDELLNFNKNKLNLKKTKSINDSNHYHSKINQIKNYLREGDVYQINYTQPMEYRLDGEAFDLYLMLLKNADPKFGAYLNIDSLKFITMSPEKFFTRENNDISSSPIKGTRKRSANKIILSSSTTMH